MSSPDFHEQFQMMSLSINSLDTGGKMLHFQEGKKQFLVYFYSRDDVMPLHLTLARWVWLIYESCSATLWYYEEFPLCKFLKEMTSCVYIVGWCDRSDKVKEKGGWGKKKIKLEADWVNVDEYEIKKYVKTKLKDKLILLGLVFCGSL